VASDTKTRTIILADLVGSTSKVTRMETEQGADFLLDATQPIEDAIKQHDGRVIKFTGDGYLGTFESADDALETADEIRNHFLRQRYTPAGIMLDGVRIVVNTADIVLEGDDIVGDGVIVVARLEKNVPPIRFG
jgi:class 3 adenylate cyclase